MTMDLKGTIFQDFVTAEDRRLYKIYDDMRLTGTKELSDQEYINNYIKENKFREDLDFVYMSVEIDQEYGLYVSRFITFESFIHKQMWIANNYKKCVGIVNLPAQKILN